MEELKNKVAIVVGASSRIGAAITKILLEEGMKVVGLDVQYVKLRKLAEQYYNKMFPVKCDPTSEKQILEAFQWTQNNVGPIHVVINSAGLVRNRSIEESTNKDLQNLIDTNLLSVTIVTREAIKTMKMNNIEGSIININSITGHYVIDYPGVFAYNASKYGVTAFTESIRTELAKEGSKIRICSLSPGFVNATSGKKSMSSQENYSELFKENSSLKVEDIANSLKFILSCPAHVNIAEITIRPTGEY